MNPQLIILFKGIGAMLLGAVIGWEREIRNKPAGLRTHMYIAGAASFLVMLGLELIRWYARFEGDEIGNSDPIRVLEAVVVGISFIGGGVIIRGEKNGQVANLTTAATILFAAVVGVAVALDLWWLGVGMTFFSIGINRLGLWFEGKFMPGGDS